MKEIWKKIPGWRAYSISNKGRVRRDRETRNSSERRTKFGIVRIGEPTKGTLHQGYLAVKLARDGGGTCRFEIGTLVLLAFRGKRPKGQVTRHLNDIPLNNNLENLSWGTYLDNLLDRKSNGIDAGFFSYRTPEEKARSRRKGRATAKKNGTLFAMAALTPLERKVRVLKILRTRKIRTGEGAYVHIKYGMAALTYRQRSNRAKKIWRTRVERYGQSGVK